MKASETRRIVEEAILKRGHAIIIQDISTAAKNGKSKIYFTNIPVDVIEVLRNDGYEVVKISGLFCVRW